MTDETLHENLDPNIPEESSMPEILEPLEAGPTSDPEFKIEKKKYDPAWGQLFAVLLFVFAIVIYILTAESESPFVLVVPIICLLFGLLGWIAGKDRDAGAFGFGLGFFFFMPGLVAILGVDRRPLCPRCGTRISGKAVICPGCHCRLRWD